MINSLKGIWCYLYGQKWCVIVWFLNLGHLGPFQGQSASYVAEGEPSEEDQVLGKVEWMNIELNMIMNINIKLCQ